MASLTIPTGIRREHVLMAAEWIDRYGVPSGRESKKYSAFISGRAYPPKLLISKANFFATGSDLSHESFAGGKETNSYLRGLGFKVLDTGSATAEARDCELNRDLRPNYCESSRVLSQHGTSSERICDSTQSDRRDDRVTSLGKQDHRGTLMSAARQASWAKYLTALLLLWLLSLVAIALSGESDASLAFMGFVFLALIVSFLAFGILWVASKMQKSPTNSRIATRDVRPNVGPACNACGARNPSQSLFCERCGHRTELEESTYHPAPQMDNRIQRQMRQVTTMNASKSMVGRLVDSSPTKTLSRVRRIAKSHDVHITSLETEIGNKDPVSCLIWQDEVDDSRKVFIFCNNEGEDEILILHARVDFEPPIYGPVGEASDTDHSELFEELMKGRTRFDPEIEDGELTSVSLFQVFPVCASDDTLSLLLGDSVKEILATADNVRTTISQARWQDEMR